MKDLDLKHAIEGLIRTKREDDYWDFKEKHHINKADLLHDIICMANNRVDRDAYIIFGIADDTGEIVGVETDANRRNQQQIIDQLKSKKFASGIRPRIEMRTFRLERREVDVYCQNSTDTPYFLVEEASRMRVGTLGPISEYTRGRRYQYHLPLRHQRRYLSHLLSRGTTRWPASRWSWT